MLITYFILDNELTCWRIHCEPGNAVAIQISAHEDVEEVTRFLLQHESTAKLAWDIVMMILIIFSSFVNPLKIGEAKKTLMGPVVLLLLLS